VSGHTATIVTMVARQVAVVAVIGVAIAASLARRPSRKRKRFPSPETDVQLARCRRCGTALPTGAQFCHSCGARAT